MQRTRNATRNIVFGTIYRIVVTIWPFALRTVMLYTLGVEYLGLNSLFSSLLNFLSLAELGVGGAMVYAMYKPIADDDTVKVCAILNLYRKLYRYIGAIILTIGLVLLPFLDRLIKGSHPSDVNIYLLYLIYLFNSVISYFLFAYKQSLLTAFQRSDIISKRTIIIQSAMYIAQIIVLIIFKNYYIYIIFLPVSTIAINIANSSVVSKMYPQYKCEGSVSKEDEKNIKKNVLALVGTKLNSVVLHSSDNIIISAYLGLTLVAQYSNYYMIIGAVASFTSIIYTSITAGIGNSIATESMEKNYRDFNILSFMNFWLIGWSAISILCLIQPFMNIWVGKDLMFPLTMAILFAAYFYIYQVNKIVLTYKDASGIWWADRFRPYVTMIVNLISNAILVQLIGIYGIIISTVITMLISVPWAAVVLYKGLFKSNRVSEYIHDAIKCTFKVLLACIITYNVCTIATFDNDYKTLGVRFVICAIIPNIILYILNLHNMYLPDAIYRINKLISRK